MLADDLSGVGPGDLVAVAVPPGPVWSEVLASVWDRGAAVLPVDTRLRSREVRQILDRARPRVVLDEDGASIRTDAAPVAHGAAAAVATSGTAGEARVAELSRAALEAALAGSSALLASTGDDAWLCCLPAAHVGGLLVLARGVIGGARVEVHPSFDPEEVARADADRVSVVPAMLRRLVRTGAALSRFRTILVGGGGLDRDTAEAARARGANIVTTYGLTETWGGIAYDGRLFEGSTARLGADAEIELAGPTLMDGYAGDAAATGAAFTTDGWLRTGDSGRIEDDGRLVVLGRLDERIRTGSETVWPAEVEAALLEHPGVAEVAVAGRPDPEWGEHVAAFVVPTTIDDPPTLEALRSHAAERIARYKAPRELVLVAALPRTSSGKIRRSALR